MKYKKIDSEIGKIYAYCQRCKLKYGSHNIPGIEEVKRADARSVCDECNDIEVLEQEAFEQNRCYKRDWDAVKQALAAGGGKVSKQALRRLSQELGRTKPSICTMLWRVAHNRVGGKGQ